MASSACHHLFLLAFVAMLAVATPRVSAWGGGRLFFSKTTRPEAAVVDEPEKTAVPAGAEEEDPNRAAAFSRPSTGGGSGRGYGLYGRPEENLPPDYFRRGVHHNTEKLRTASGAEEAVPVGGRGAEPLSAEDNGSGRGRPPRYYGPAADGTPEEQRNYYGMSDTRLYQNGRYYYDVDAGRYGYGRESNPVRTRPEEFAAGDRRGRYGSASAAAAGYRYRYGDGNGFQEEEQNGRYIP